MSRKETFVAPSVRLEWDYDRWNGWRVTAWRPHITGVFTNREALLKFINWPSKTPTGDLIRGWIDSQIEQVGAAGGAVASNSRLPNGIPELLATGFGPEVFDGELDTTDPNHQTRTVI
jgi:hypothetical protein